MLTPAGSSTRRLGRVTRNTGLFAAVSVLVSAAIVANVRPAVIELIMGAVGLGYLGQGTAELLTHLTEGLVVLLLLAAYVERWPFRQIEHRLMHLESEVDRKLNELRADHLQAQEARRQLRELVEERCQGRLGNLLDLVLPEEVSPVLNATIEIQLREPQSDDSTGAGDLYHWRYTNRFTSHESAYIIGLVTSKGHVDRLYDANAPIHEILVVLDSDAIDRWSASQIVEHYDIRLQHLDQRSSSFIDAHVERIEDTSVFWRPRTDQDLFPLVLLRMTLDEEAAEASGTRDRSLRLTYQTTQFKSDGFCFWTASWPTFVDTITVNASQLSGVHGFKFERFLPNFDRTGTQDIVVDGVYTVMVENWILKGHGVILTWQRSPITPEVSSLRRPTSGALPSSSPGV